MLKVNEIKVEKDSDICHVLKKAGRILGVRPEEIRDFKVLKKSVDARKKDNLLEVYSVLVSVDHEDRVLKRCRDKRVSVAEDKGYRYPEHGKEEAKHRPVVIGFGPAGIFAALVLAHEGYRPLVFDRGRSIEDRAEASSVKDCIGLTKVRLEPRQLRFILFLTLLSSNMRIWDNRRIS